MRQEWFSRVQWQRRFKMKLIHAGITALLLGATGIAANAATSPDFIAQPAPSYTADRTVYLGPGTRYVNVTHGETVKFVSDSGAFTLAFYGAPEPVNLQYFAPPGVLDHRVNAFVNQSTFDSAN
jgi:hypothetical protein